MTFIYELDWTAESSGGQGVPRRQFRQRGDEDETREGWVEVEMGVTDVAAPSTGPEAWVARYPVQGEGWSMPAFKTGFLGRLWGSHRDERVKRKRRL